MPSRSCLNEEQIVSLIARFNQTLPKDDSLLMGPGDDCAIIQHNLPLAVTTDMLVEGVHFRSSYMSFYEIGYRAMAVNLSDLAAMGARPVHAMLSLGLPESPDRDQVNQFMRGLTELPSAHGFRLAGGDTVRSSQLTINLCLLGALQYAPLLRSQAKAGQQIWVTGPLGQAHAGLYCLEHNLAGNAQWQTLVDAHKRPLPRLAAGACLARHGLEGAVMDISDGLASDAARLCHASGLGARLYEKMIPLTAATRNLAEEVSQNPLDWALFGGEDFELLFTAWPAQAERMAFLLRELGLKPARVGEMEQGAGVWLEGAVNAREISFKGFDHFG